MTGLQLLNYSIISVPAIIYFLGNFTRNSFSNRQKKLLNFAILDQIDKICDLLKLPFKRYIAAIILTESGGNIETTGSVGEIGLMQIYEPTFDWLNRKYNFNFTYNELYAIQPNIYVGCLLFKDNLKTLNYDFFDAIKSYNVGIDLKPEDKASYYLTKVLTNAS